MVYVKAFLVEKVIENSFLVVIDAEKPGVNLVKFLILQTKFIGKFKSRR